MLALAFLPLVACGGERPSLPVATVETRPAVELTQFPAELSQFQGETIHALEQSHSDWNIPMPTLSGAMAQAAAHDWPAQLSDADMDRVLALAGWPPELWAEAKAVACGIGNPTWTRGESGCSLGAIGDGGNSLGLFQLNAATWAPYCGITRDDLMEAVPNATCAYRVYQYDLSRGQPAWGQWTVKPW